MHKSTWTIFIYLLFTICLYAQTIEQTDVPPPAKPQEEYLYKTTPHGELTLHINFPSTWRKNQNYPAVVFFAGEWVNGSVEQFAYYARYLAERGMIAARAEYRLLSNQEISIVDCIRDAKSAIRWLRKHASELGIDPNRIAAAGGFAGGYLAACTAHVSGYEEGKEDWTLSSKSNLLILLNPLLSVTNALFAQRLPDNDIAKDISPLLHVDEETPPTILVCGSQDALYPQAQEYFNRAYEHEADAALFVADKQGRGFFNNPPWLQQTLLVIDTFLIEHGYLQAPPGIEPDSKATFKKLTTKILTEATHDPLKTGRFTARFTEHSPLTTAGELNKRFQFALGMEALNMNHQARPYNILAESFEVYVPESYDLDTSYGLWVHISPSEAGDLPGKSLIPVLEDRKVIWIGANKSGNDHSVYERRIPLALDAAYNMKNLYNIDPDRVYVEGVSGGGRTASMTAFHHPDVWKGGIFIIGVNYWERMENPENPGTYWRASFNKPKKEYLQQAAQEGRYVFLTGDRDSNRAQTKAYFENAYNKFLQNAIYIQVPNMGHRLPPIEWLVKAIDYVDKK